MARTGKKWSIFKVEFLLAGWRVREVKTALPMTKNADSFCDYVFLCAGKRSFIIKSVPDRTYKIILRCTIKKKNKKRIIVAPSLIDNYIRNKMKQQKENIWKLQNTFLSALSYW